MAQAEITTEIVCVETEQASLELKLSLREAEVLKALCNTIIGSDNGDRGIVTGIWRAIDKAEEGYGINGTEYQLKADPRKSRLSPDDFAIWVY